MINLFIQFIATRRTEEIVFDIELNPHCRFYENIDTIWIFNHRNVRRVISNESRAKMSEVQQLFLAIQSRQLKT